MNVEVRDADADRRLSKHDPSAEAALPARPQAEGGRREADWMTRMFTVPNERWNRRTGNGDGDGLGCDIVIDHPVLSKRSDVEMAQKLPKTIEVSYLHVSRCDGKHLMVVVTL